MTTTTIIAEIKAVWVSFVNKLNVKYVLVLTKNMIFFFNVIKLDAIYLHISHACIIDAVDKNI